MCTCWEIEFFVFLLLHHMAIIRACMCAQSLSHVRLCDPMDCSLIDSSVNGIFQARILEQVAISYSKRSSQSRYQTRISCMSWIGRQIFFFFLNHWATWEALSEHRNQWKHSFNVGTPSKSQPLTYFSLLFLKFRGTDIWLIFSWLSVTSGKNTKYDIHLEYWQVNSCQFKFLFFLHRLSYLPPSNTASNYINKWSN